MAKKDPLTYILVKLTYKEINTETTKQVEKEIGTEKELSTEKDQVDSFEVTGKGHIDGFGDTEIVGVGFNNEIKIDGSKPVKMGPVELFIHSVSGVNVKPSGDPKKVIFHNKEEVKLILVDMSAVNTSDKEISFHPNQSIITTDTGEKLEPMALLESKVGRDFLRKEKKEGPTGWELKNIDKDIKELTLTIKPPNGTEEMKDPAKEKKLVFNVLPWELVNEQ